MIAEKLPTNIANVENKSQEEKFSHPQGSPIEKIDYILSDDEQIHLYEIQSITGWPIPNPLTDSLNPKIRESKTNKLQEKNTNIPNKFPDGNPETTREDFGPGNAGEQAYQAIKQGAECVTFIDDEHNICGELSIGTIDMDSSTRLDLFPYCSDEHGSLLVGQLIQDKDEVTSNLTARNGFGRS